MFLSISYCFEMFQSYYQFLWITINNQSTYLKKYIISISFISFATNSGHEIDASSIILRKLDDWLQRSKIWRNVKARNHLLCLLVFNGFLVLSHYMSQCSECFRFYFDDSFLAIH